jgi:hypothetical protein
MIRRHFIVGGLEGRFLWTLFSGKYSKKCYILLDSLDKLKNKSKKIKKSIDEGKNPNGRY